jgi:hypothetical protein
MPAALSPFPLEKTADQDAYQRLRRAHREFHALPWWRRRARKRLAAQVAKARTACIAAGPVATPYPYPGAESDARPILPPPVVREEFPMPSPSRTRRILAGGGGLAGVIGLLAILNATGANPLPASVPVLGENADSVFHQIQADGVPITDGEPSDAKFRDMTRHNACQSSRSFVRSDADQGWGVICVRPPRDVFRRISDAYNDVPMLVGPLYVDDDNGHLVIFGFGWPSNASKMIADAIHANGSYLEAQ